MVFAALQDCPVNGPHPPHPLNNACSLSKSNAMPFVLFPGVRVPSVVRPLILSTNHAFRTSAGGWVVVDSENGASLAEST